MGEGVHPKNTGPRRLNPRLAMECRARPEVSLGIIKRFEYSDAFRFWNPTCRKTPRRPYRVRFARTRSSRAAARVRSAAKPRTVSARSVRPWPRGADEMAELKVNELAWIIGGAQGSGVDSSATAFARASAYGGLHVYGKREYYSNIMGEHSYFQVRVCGRPIRSHVDTLNLLATFDAETIFRHVPHVLYHLSIVYDPGLAKGKLGDAPTIEARLEQDLTTYLVARGLGFTVEDLLKSAADRGVSLVPIPYAQLLTEVADENHIDQ